MRPPAPFGAAAELGRVQHQLADALVEHFLLDFGGDQARQLAARQWLKDVPVRQKDETDMAYCQGLSQKVVDAMRGQMDRLLVQVLGLVEARLQTQIDHRTGEYVHLSAQCREMRKQRNDAWSDNAALRAYAQGLEERQEAARDPLVPETPT